MKSALLAGLVWAVALAFMAPSASASTLSEVRARGYLECGVNSGLAGFADADAKGNWKGFDVDFCRAIAAAVFGGGSKVKFIPTSTEDRFDALLSRKIDVLARNTTWTLSRDARLGVDFAGIDYYDGQGFMIDAKKLPGVTSALQLNGARVCVQKGTTSELNLADYFKANHMQYSPMPFDKLEAATAAYDAGRCDVITDDQSGLYAIRLTLKNPDEHVVLPEIISKEPLGLAVRHGDDQWFDLVKWTIFAMIDCEELGVTQANVEDMRKSDSPQIRRILGADKDVDYGADLGVGRDWVVNIVKAVGNYGEVFDRNLGADSPLKIKRGLNQLWKKGGILYAPPIR